MTGATINKISERNSSPKHLNSVIIYSQKWKVIGNGKWLHTYIRCEPRFWTPQDAKLMFSSSWNVFLTTKHHLTFHQHDWMTFHFRVNCSFKSGCCWFWISYTTIVMCDLPQGHLGRHVWRVVTVQDQNWTYILMSFASCDLPHFTVLRIPATRLTHWYRQFRTWRNGKFRGWM